MIHITRLLSPVATSSIQEAPALGGFMNIRIIGKSVDVGASKETAQ